ncbi:MAG: 4Fe-4S dicluster domain-containing protein [Clostridia bacterium]|nr:4Fe-4S dicluster domain-containing protein [Clostridia bacterium]
MRKISLDKLDALFAALANKQSLYIPADSAEGAKFTKWADGVKLSNALNTVRGIKDFFFPQSEDLMKFKMQGKNIDVIDIRDEHEDFVIFGARACDVRAMAVLDKVFLQEPIDTYYQNRREHGVIMSMACTRPAETCFCGAFGIDAANPEGDIVCHKTDDTLYMNAVTQKGEALLTSLSDITEDCDTKAVDEQKALIKERMAELPLAPLTTDAFGGGKTEKFFNSPEWEKLSESCLGCGTCTFVCPTCQCYDIRDFKTNDGVVRYRCWDSCMYSQFTRMAHGNNRNSQKERFRQRFMHKLVYFPENNNGMFSCVGCGRCLAKCPIRMNIVKVMKTLEGDNNG